MSYIFIKTIDEANPHDHHNVKIEIPNHDADLDTLLGSFEDFLKACGFLMKGHLDFAEDEREDT